MKVAVTVTDKSEGERLNNALRDEAARALMNVVGALMPLSARDRHRVLAFVESGFEDRPPGPIGPSVQANRELVGI